MAGEYKFLGYVQLKDPVTGVKSGTSASPSTVSTTGTSSVELTDKSGNTASISGGAMGIESKSEQQARLGNLYVGSDVGAGVSHGVHRKWYFLTASTATQDYRMLWDATAVSGGQARLWEATSVSDRVNLGQVTLYNSDRTISTTTSCRLFSDVGNDGFIVATSGTLIGNKFSKNRWQPTIQGEPPLRLKGNTAYMIEVEANDGPSASNIKIQFYEPN